jgi:hypothetical protein
MAGGGVRGKGAGIILGTIIQVGSTIETFHIFIERYHRAGGMTTGIIAGKGINGTTSEYRTTKSRGTGTPGKRTGIGRSKILGVSRVWNPKRDHNSRIRQSNQNLMEISSIESRPSHSTHDHNTERSSHSTASHNTGKHNSNLNMGMENLKKGIRETRIKSKKKKNLRAHDRSWLAPSEQICKWSQPLIVPVVPQD